MVSSPVLKSHRLFQQFVSASLSVSEHGMVQAHKLIQMASVGDHALLVRDNRENASFRGSQVREDFE